MALFDLPPKDSPRALFGRRNELEQLTRFIDQRRWSVILGPRMVGKTSLAKAAVRASGRPSVYVNLWGARGTQGFVEAFVAALNANRSVRSRVARFLGRIQGLSLGPAGITLAPQARTLRTLWDLVGLIGEQSERTVIILDEVQELAAISGVMLRALANLFNTYPGLVFVFTGSFFGILRTLVEPSAESPMFGRPPATVRLEPFDRDVSVEFLRAGLQEHGLRLNAEELTGAVDRTLDGLPGWLTLFGNHVAVERLSLDAAELATRREAKKVARSEVAHFLEHRPVETYWTALRALTTELSWSELREALAARRGGRVNDHTVGNALRSLRDAGFVVERDRRYVLRDPMVRAFVREAERVPH
jgi:uncharacterized protein